MELDHDNLAESVLAMQAGEVPNFVRQSVRSRQLAHMVRDLNRQALSKIEPQSRAAASALRKLGFTE